MTWLEVLPRLPTVPPGNKLIWNSACLHKIKEFKDCAGRKRVLTYCMAWTQRKVAWITERLTETQMLTHTHTHTRGCVRKIILAQKLHKSISKECFKGTNHARLLPCTGWGLSFVKCDCFDGFFLHSGHIKSIFLVKSESYMNFNYF